jgi:hypothetical protein
MNRALLVLLLAASVAAIAEEPKAKPVVASKPAAAAPAAKAAPAVAIVANKSSKTFHKADCKAAGEIKDANKTTFPSAAEATKAGYKACKVCKP